MQQVDVAPLLGRQIKTAQLVLPIVVTVETLESELEHQKMVMPV
jgi:hypothetical protein